jgi:hypothetical protein
MKDFDITVEYDRIQPDGFMYRVDPGKRAEAAEKLRPQF